MSKAAALAGKANFDDILYIARIIHRRAFMKLVLTYTIFAVLATLANIGTQAGMIHLYQGSLAIGLSVLAGTAVGLVVKYLLDKHYIFRFRTRNVAHDGQVFMLYTLMGVVTTLIFWGTEFGFQVIFQTDIMRYLGGVVGLTIGYVAKYHLDKRYVFQGGNT